MPWFASQSSSSSKPLRGARIPEGFVRSEIRRTNRNLFVTNILIAAAMVWGIVIRPEEGTIAWIAIVGSVWVVSIWNLWRLRKRTLDDSKHPIARELASYGKLATLAVEIDNEVASCSVINSSRLIVTRNWFIGRSKYGLVVIPISVVRWVYKKATRHSINYIIPTGKTYALVVHTEDHGTHETEMSEHEVDKAMQFLYTRNPSARFGYGIDRADR